MMSFLQSPRFLSFIGHAFAIGTIAILNDFSANLNLLNLSAFWVTAIGLALAQIIGALKNIANRQPAGFSAIVK